MFDTEKENRVSISAILEDLVKNHKSKKVSFDDIIKSFHERGFGFLLIIFVLPNCIPVPSPPGLSTIISIPVIFIALQMLTGRDSPWIPAWLGKKEMNKSTLELLVSKTVPFLRVIEKLLKPRLQFLNSTPKAERYLGIILLILSGIMALPIPFMNFLPAVTVVVISISLISKDGIVTLIGIGMFFFILFIIALMFFFAPKLAIAILTYIGVI